MCPQGNIKDRPLSLDKRGVVEKAYNSFLNTFKKSSVVFIIDKPEKWIMEMVKNCPLNNNIIESDTFDWQSGNETTFKMQLSLASRSSEPSLLLEDDYLWVDKDAEEILSKSIDELGFVSPYDHPNHYFEEGYTKPREVVVVADRHWQSIVSTTLTFGARPDLIRDYWDKLNGSGTVDDLMWKSIDHKLWSPIPTLAIHMERDFCSPTYKWEKILKT